MDVSDIYLRYQDIFPESSFSHFTPITSVDRTHPKGRNFPYYSLKKRTSYISQIT